MKKSILIGIIIVIIFVGIIGVISSSNIETSEVPSLDIIEETNPEQIIVEPENTGRDLSVELEENFGLSSGP